MRSRRTMMFMMSLAATLLVAFASVPAEASTAVALWHMDETSGTTMTDSTSNHNNGTLFDVGFDTPGFDGQGAAYVFNGTSSRVVVPDSPSLNSGSQNITVTVHVKFTQPPSPTVGDYDVIRKGGSQIYKIEIFQSGQAHCQFAGNIGKKSITFGPNLADGAWHTIACTKTPSSITLSVDGVSKSISVSVGSIFNTNKLAIGGKVRAGGDMYNGSVDEVSLLIG